MRPQPAAPTPPLESPASVERQALLFLPNFKETDNARDEDMPGLRGN